MKNKQQPNEPKGIIDIPSIDDKHKLMVNKEKAMMKGDDFCPCCGKSLPNPKYFINSIFGGAMYPANDKNVYNDAWEMGVGSECRKKIPEGYLFTL